MKTIVNMEKETPLNAFQIGFIYRLSKISHEPKFLVRQLSKFVPKLQLCHLCRVGVLVTGDITVKCSVPETPFYYEETVIRCRWFKPKDEWDSALSNILEKLIGSEPE